MNHVTRLSILILALSAAGGCGDTTPRALVEGQDSCDFCRMSISDLRFGAQLITSTGKVHTFDSIECLAGFAASLPAITKVSGIYVTDFREAGSFVAAEAAIYLVDGRVESPMGRRVVAFASTVSSDELVATYGGEVKTWAEVTALLADERVALASTHRHGHGPATPEGARAH